MAPGERLWISDWSAVLESAPDRLLDIGDLLNQLNVQPRKLDLMIDFGPIPAGVVDAVAEVAKELLTEISQAAPWRTLVLASTTFPANLAVAHDRNRVGIAEAYVARGDWQAWRLLADLGKAIGDPLAFADYCVQHPSDVDIDPRALPLIPNIRYALEDRWLILRGADLKKVPQPTFAQICMELINRPEFMGVDFSAGDKSLDDYANRRDRCPNRYGAWRRPCVTHHPTLVVRQLKYS